MYFIEVVFLFFYSNRYVYSKNLFGFKYSLKYDVSPHIFHVIRYIKFVNFLYIFGSVIYKMLETKYKLIVTVGIPSSLYKVFLYESISHFFYKTQGKLRFCEHGIPHFHKENVLF